MKNLKQLSFFALTLVFILSSCSIEKRQYMRGYYISSNYISSNHNSSKQKITEDKTEAVKQAEIGTDAIEDNTTASLDNSVMLPSPKPKPISFIHNVTKAIKETDSTPSPSKFLKNYTKQTKIKKATDDRGDGDNKNLSIVGLVLGILGCVGYYAGPLFALGAIIVSAIALSKIKKDPSEYGGKTMATWGLILGIVAFVVWILVIALFVGSLFLI